MIKWSNNKLGSLGASLFFIQKSGRMNCNDLWIAPLLQVVITKLRSTNAPAMEHDHQNWKAAKALLVIIPLLGITYIFTIYGPTDSASWPHYIFIHIRACLLSLQVCTRTYVIYYL